MDDQRSVARVAGRHLARSTQQRDSLHTLLKSFEESFGNAGSWYRRRRIKTDKDQLARKISAKALAVVRFMVLRFEDAAFGKRIKKRLRRWENFKKMLTKISTGTDWDSLLAVLEKIDTKSKDAWEKYWEYKKFALMVLDALDTEFEGGIEVQGHHVELFTTPMGEWDSEQIGKVKAVIRSADSLLSSKGLGKAFGGRIQAWPSRVVPPSGKGSHNTLASYNPHHDLLRLAAGGKFRATVRTAIHELGHRWYFRVMGSQGRAAWTEFFGDNVAPPDLSEIMAEWERFAKVHEYGAWLGYFIHHVKQKMPDQRMWLILAADQAGIHEDFHPMTGQPSRKKSNRPGLDQMKEKLAEIKVFMHPVTAYSGTSPEELFAETFAYIVTDGPRRIPPIVRDAFSRAVPQARVAASVPRVAARHRAGLIQAPPKLYASIKEWALAVVAHGRVYGTKDTVPASEAEAAKWKPYLRSGVKPTNSRGGSKKEFDVDLEGWLQLTDKVRRHAEEKAALDPSEVTRPLFKLYDTITVDLTHMDSLWWGNAAAAWSESKGLLVVDLPWFDNDDDISRSFDRKSGRDIKHELIHMGQSILSDAFRMTDETVEVHGEAFVVKRRPRPGMPSRRIMTPEHIQKTPHLRPEERRKIERTLGRSLPFGSEVEQHHLDDIEYYTILADAVEEFRTLDLTGLNRAEKNLALALFTSAKAFPGDPSFYSERKKWIALDPRKKVYPLTLLRRNGLKPNRAFEVWKKRARGKWRKGLKELTKAVL